MVLFIYQNTDSVTFIGTETLAAIIPSLIYTTDDAIDRFHPENRKCYQDSEFDLPNLRYADGYRYSHNNCLYQAVIENTIKNCSCLPSFAQGRRKEDIELCRGKKLNCALKWINQLGNEEKPDLTKTRSTKNEELKCYQRCENQYETILSSSSLWPSEMFQLRTDLCYVMDKVASKICNDPAKQAIFHQSYGSKISCSQIGYVYNTLGLCKNTKYPSYATLKNEDAKKVVKFMTEYAQDNFVILKMFINYPFYTKIMRDEDMTILSFIANTGGLLGLCLGMSFVSVFEIFYFIYNLLFQQCKRWLVN